MNCILYARVSTDKQAEKDLSIPAQLRLMREHARQQGWGVIEECIEPGMTATNAERPVLQQLLRRIAAGELKVDIVLAHKLNRLARNLDDYVPIRAALWKRGVRLAYVVEKVDDSASGRLLENVMASIAQFESANLSEETKKGMRQKVLQGGWPHRPPRGYVMVRRSDGTGTKSECEIHPREGPLVTRAFTLFAGGQVSANTVAIKLAAEGLMTAAGSPVSQSYMRRMLTNPFYVGRIEWQGLHVKGRHRPLVEESLFERVQEVIQRRYIRPLRHKTTAGFPLKGLAACARCRGHMTAERHGRHHYYRCSRQANRHQACDARYCPADRAHRDVCRLLKGLQLSRDKADMIAEAVDRQLRLKAETESERRRALAHEQSNVLFAEARLTEVFLAGQLSPAAYQQKAFELRSKRDRLERDAQAARLPTNVLQERAKRSLDISTSMYDLYEQWDDWRRSELLKLIFTGVVLGGDGVVGFGLRPPFDTVQSARPVEEQANAILDAHQPLSANSFGLD
jgi:site-specific DNA recombinase